jgi:hypothetical protein
MEEVEEFQNDGLEDGVKCDDKKDWRAVGLANQTAALTRQMVMRTKTIRPTLMTRPTRSKGRVYKRLNH